jgi:hypothetical protein
MGAPLKLDGLGYTGVGSSDSNSVAIVENREKFLAFFATEAVTKGDLVALDFSDTEPANGYGNHIKICDTGDALNAHGIGVAAEAIAAGDVGMVQVAGMCDFAKLDESAVANGGLLAAGADAGLLDVYTTDAAAGSGGDTLPVAISVKENATGTADEADSVIFLLNPANL